MRKLCAGLLGLLVPLQVLADEPKKVPVTAGVQTININVGPAAPVPPTVDFTLYGRHGHVTPHRYCLSHTGGGYIDVAQPTPDVIVVTMTGIAVAVGTPCNPGVAEMDFDLNQCLEVVFEKPEVKKAKLTIEGRLIGLLRSDCKGGGAAEENHAMAVITPDLGPVDAAAPGPVAGPLPGPGALPGPIAGPTPGEVVSITLPDHAVAGGENLSINDHCGPINVAIGAGKYVLHQTFHIAATHDKYLFPCKASSAEFAPDPALDPLWISYWEPFHGVIKKDFGFQITIKVAEDTAAPAAPQAPKEKEKEKPAPQDSKPAPQDSKPEQANN